MIKFKDLIKQRGTYIFCPRCGSPAVTHGRPQVFNSETVRTESYLVDCQQCGLKGAVEELWDWREEKNKEDTQ